MSHKKNTQRKLHTYLLPVWIKFLVLWLHLWHTSKNMLRLTNCLTNEESYSWNGCDWGFSIFLKKPGRPWVLVPSWAKKANSMTFGHSLSPKSRKNTWASHLKSQENCRNQQMQGVKNWLKAQKWKSEIMNWYYCNQWLKTLQSLRCQDRNVDLDCVVCEHMNLWVGD